MSRLRIAILCYHGYGGSGVLATELGIALADRGHSVHFITSESPYRLFETYKDVYYHHVEVPQHPLLDGSAYFLALSAKVVDLHARYSFDILHAHYAIPHAICGYLVKQVLKTKSMKLVTTLHGTDVTLLGLGQDFYGLVRFGVEESDAVTAVSRYLQQRVLEEFAVVRPVKLIYNFVDTRRFTPEKSPEFSFDSQVVMHVSNFRSVKNIQGVVRCFAEVVRRRACVLVLAGDGPEVCVAQELAAELRVAEYLVYCGKVAHVERLLPCADVLLFPSYSESFGLVLLEAMSCGVPTVSSNVGGIPEVVEEGKSGFMFHPDDYHSMANKIVEILSQKDLHEYLSQNARHYALNKFNKQQILDSYETLYRDVL